MLLNVADAAADCCALLILKDVIVAVACCCCMQYRDPGGYSGLDVCYDSRNVKLRLQKLQQLKTTPLSHVESISCLNGGGCVC